MDHYRWLSRPGSLKSIFDEGLFRGDHLAKLAVNFSHSETPRGKTKITGAASRNKKIHQATDRLTGNERAELIDL